MMILQMLILVVVGRCFPDIWRSQNYALIGVEFSVVASPKKKKCGVKY